MDDHGRVQVRGEDQLFSYEGSLGQSRTAAISGAGGFVDSNSCAAGEIWCVTTIASRDQTTATTRHGYSANVQAALHNIGEVERAIPAWRVAYLYGWWWLNPGEFVRVDFIGGLAGDLCYVALTGYRMTLEV